MKLLPSVLLALTALSWCAKPASAGEERTDQKKEAVALFNSGVSFFNNGEHQKAVDSFRKANRLFPAWKLQYNIGQCEAALKRYGLAIEAFEHYLGAGGDDIPEERRDEVLNELDRLRRMVANVRVKGEDGVGIFIDGIERGRTPMQSPILVTAGVEHWFWLVNTDGSKLLSVKDTVSGGQTLELTTPGYKTQTETTPEPVNPEQAEAEPNAAQETTAEPAPEKPTETSAEPESAPAVEQPRMEPASAKESPFEENPPRADPILEDEGISPVLFWVGASSTLAFGALTLTMALLVDSKWDKAEKNPTNDAVRKNGSSLQIVGYVALALTGAALITTAVAAPLTRWKKRERAVSKTSLSINPWAVAGAGGIVIDGRFSL